MSARESFIASLGTQPLQKGDAIVLLQGDGHHRVSHTVQLYEDGMAPMVVLVGGADNREYGSYPSKELRDLLLEKGLPEGALHFEETAAHTRAEADRAIAIASERGWQNILIVTSPHHMYRAFLTFVASLKDAGSTMQFQISPARLPWFTEVPWGVRADLLAGELERIEEYGKLGHVASYEEGLEYLKVQEQQAP